MSMIPSYFFREIMRPLRMMESQMRAMDEAFFRSPWNNFPKITYDITQERDAVIQDKDKFQVKLDVQHFKPEEITVKTVDGNAIHIEAKHEEKHDEDKSYISRQFVRRFILPKGHDIKNATSTLSPDGVLTITAPKTMEAIEDKTIPIKHEGESNEK